MADVTITVGGIAHRVALPFGLDVLEDAGDALDRFNALVPELLPFYEAGAAPPMRLIAKAARSALEVFCIAINTGTPGAVDFDFIRSRTSLEDSRPLIDAMNAALRGSGFEPKDDGAGEIGAASSVSPSRRKSAKSSRA